MTQASDLASALTSYENSRMERTKVIQARSAVGEMRYYQPQTETSGQTSNNDDFPDWLYKYQPFSKKS